MNKPRFLIFLFLLIIRSVDAQSPLVKQWDKRYGGIGLDELKMVEQTNDGGYILGGSTPSGNTGDKSQPSWGSWDYWIVKLDSLGNKVWDKRFGGSSMDDFTALAQAHDGGYLIAGTSSSPISGDKTQSTSGVTDFWVVKIDSHGIKEWDKRYGGNKRENLTCLSITTDNGYILGGSTASGIGGDVTVLNRDSTLLTGDYWIIKIDSVGNKQWDNRYGGLKNDLIHSIQQTSDRGYILGGVSNSGISGDKTQANWSNTFDYWIVKIDSSGNKQWDKRYGTINVEDLIKIIQTKDQGYIIIGGSSAGIDHDKSDTCRGIYDYWVIKLDANGDKEWDKTYGSSARDEVVNVVQTREGGYLISGDSYSPIGGEKTDSNLGYQCVWLVKIDTSGNVEWDKTVQTYGENDIGYAIQTRDGSIVIADGNNSGIGGEKTQAGWDSFPSQPMTFYDTDYWIIKYQDTSNYCHLQTVTLVGDSSSICVGDSVRLCAPQGFAHYAWNNGVTTSCLYANVSGNYYITVTDDNLCTVESNRITISTYAIPSVSVSQNDDTLMAYNAISYQWYLNNAIINGANENFYLPIEQGSYSVMITDSNGCMATSNPIVVTGIEPIETNNILISPNPFVSHVSATLTGKNTGPVTYTITTLTGQTVYHQTESNLAHGNTKLLDLSYLPKGMYFVEVTANGEKTVKRIVKE